MYFIYENNKSMSKAIRESITETFGFEPICINSALASAQNRYRLYWVGKRNPDGTYSKVHVDQPEDRGILLRDVLDGAFPYRCTADGKAFCSDANYWKTPGSPETFLEGGHARAQRSMVAEPIKLLSEREMEYMVRAVKDGRNHFDFGHFHDGTQDKSRCITATIAKGVPYNVVCEPVRVGTWPNNAKNQAHDSQQYRIYSTDAKSVTLCGNGGGMGAKTGLYAIPLNITDDGKSQTIKAQYHFTSIPNICCYSSTYGATCVAIPTDQPASEQFLGAGKDRNAMKRIYEVKDGEITIKGQKYPIKLPDGCYIIRKLTVSECKRLQTVPEWYEFPVSDTQAYKMLGNGWTVLVIAHLIITTQADYAEEFEEYQLNIFEMVGV
jgi:DNA (cytosine-5)-methyltransferase 3A